MASQCKDIGSHIREGWLVPDIGALSQISGAHLTGDHRIDSNQRDVPFVPYRQLGPLTLAGNVPPPPHTERTATEVAPTSLMSIPRGSRDEPSLPGNVMEMMWLRPVFVFVDCFKQPLDYALNIKFPLNFIIWDVFKRMRSAAEDLGEDIEFRDGENGLVNLESYLLEYMANKGSFIYVYRRAEDTKLPDEPMWLDVLATCRTYPVQQLNQSALSLNGGEFLRKLSTLLSSAGYLSRLQVFNSDFEELTADVPNVLGWLNSSSDPQTLRLVPLGTGGPLTPVMLRPPFYSMTAAQMGRFGGLDASHSGLLSQESLESAIPSVHSLSSPKGAAGTHHRGQVDEGVTEPTPVDKELNISLLNGVALKLSSANYEAGPHGLEFHKEVVDALREITDVFSGKKDAASFSDTNQSAERIHDAALGRELRQRLSGTHLLTSWQSLSDEAVARNAVGVLKAESGAEALMARHLARDYIELRAKVRRLEALQETRYPWQRGFFTRPYQMLVVLGAKSVQLAKFLWWGFHQEVTLVCLYTLFWLWTLRMVVSDTVWLKPYIQSVLLAYLAFNVLHSIALNHFHYDLFTVIIRGFPKIYPENAVSAVGSELIRAAAIESLRGAELNMNAIVNASITKPPVGQIVLISTMSVVPSLLGKWHDLVNKRRKKAMDEISAAIEAEKSKIGHVLAEGRSTEAARPGEGPGPVVVPARESNVGVPAEVPANRPE